MARQDNEEKQSLIADVKPEVSDKPKKDTQPKIRTRDVGVWRIVQQAESTRFAFFPGRDTYVRMKEITQGLPHVWRCLKEVWSVAPGYFLLWISLMIWSSLDSAISLWVTATLLDTLQSTILNGKADMDAVRLAFGIKFAYFVSEWLNGWLRNLCRNTLKMRTTSLFGGRILDLYTRMDLVTLQRKDVQTKLKRMSGTLLGDRVWNEFQDIVRQSSIIVEILSQGSFLASFFRSQENGLVLAAICLFPPIVKGIISADYFSGAWFAHAINKDYLRLRSVGDTAISKNYHEEIISGGMTGYLQKEYRNALARLGNITCSNIYTVLWEEAHGVKEFIDICLNDVPLLYYLGAVVRKPSSFSLTSLTVMRESANAFAWTIWRLFQSDNTLKDKIQIIRDYYELLEIKNTVVDGLLPYPDPEHSLPQGMKIEFKNVSMKYPDSDKFALENVSFTIEAGATVVLVGENGSGKTTTVNLLSRLMDCTSGEILIDDQPLSAYQVTQIRDTQAVLRQSYQHFPFTIRENIGIGLPKHADDMERIETAAKLGGAHEIIEEIKVKEKTDYNASLHAGESGWDINVNPVTTWTGSWLLNGSALEDMSSGLEKSIELSGGQWQRLALSRLFMRAASDDIRMVCVDEPSAALDPRAEFEIFKHLRELGAKKRTRIFITHRFGHLTKYADLILCLKKGHLVEVGTHDQLLKANGEYATLYNIQAQAFA